jgi:hypothetical protein
MNRLERMPCFSRRSLSFSPRMMFALLVLCLLRAIPAGAQATTQTSIISFSGAGGLHSYCTGEDIAVNYSILILQHLTIMPNGDGHAEANIIIHGDGVGLTSGTRYVFYNSSRNNQDVVRDAQGAYETTVEATMNLIATGEHTPGDDQLIHVIFHITVTPAGDCTAFVENIFGTCR